MKKWLSLILKIGVTIGILAVIAAKTDVPKIAALLMSVSGGTSGKELGLAASPDPRIIFAQRRQAAKKGAKK